MTPIQIITAIIGGLIILSYFVDFKTLLSKFKKEEVMSEEKLQDVMLARNNTENTTLASVVAQWEKLKNDCESRGLTEASAKLEEVFPLLIKKG